MPVRPSKFYNAFGEVMYSLTMANGSIQKERLSTITSALKDHEWSNGILWSFDYEKNKQNDVSIVLQRALLVFREHGPSKEYEFLRTLLKDIAGLSTNEDQQTKDFINCIEKEIKTYNSL